MCRCGDRDWICNRIDQNCDGCRCGLLVAVGAFGRDGDDGHPGEQPARVRRRQEIDVTYLYRRQRVGPRAVAGDREWILHAQSIEQTSGGFDAADFHDMRFRAIDQIAERGRQIVEMHHDVFVGDLVFAGRRHRIGHGLDIDDVVEMHRLAILVARQARIDIRLDRSHVDSECDTAIEIDRRRHTERRKQILDLLRASHNDERAVRLRRDRARQRRIPVERCTKRQSGDDDLLDRLRAVGIIEVDSHRGSDPYVFRSGGAARDRGGIGNRLYNNSDRAGFRQPGPGIRELEREHGGSGEPVAWREYERSVSIEDDGSGERIRNYRAIIDR